MRFIKIIVFVISASLFTSSCEDPEKVSENQASEVKDSETSEESLTIPVNFGKLKGSSVAIKSSQSSLGSKVIVIDGEAINASSLPQELGIDTKNVLSNPMRIVSENELPKGLEFEIAILMNEEIDLGLQDEVELIAVYIFRGKAESFGYVQTKNIKTKETFAQFEIISSQAFSEVDIQLFEKSELIIDENQSFDTVLTVLQGGTRLGAQSEIDFGLIQTESLEQRVILTIENAGLSPLYITETKFVGGESDQFKVITAPNSFYSPGSSGTFEISFTPTSDGAKISELQIMSNDPDIDAFKVIVKGLAEFM